LDLGGVGCLGEIKLIYSVFVGAFSNSNAKSRNLTSQERLKNATYSLDSCFKSELICPPYGGASNLAIQDTNLSMFKLPVKPIIRFVSHGWEK
jgi:hypothetical protein